ncbi:MAG: hypothetical protein ACK5M0_03145 [Bacteroidales bacterium]
MNLKHYLAAIFSAAILSFSFLACDPKEDDPTTNPTPSTDVVKEIHGFYGKPAVEVLSILDAKGWTRREHTFESGANYQYINSDSTKTYFIETWNDTVIFSEYNEFEKGDVNQEISTVNIHRFIQTFENWENTMSQIPQPNTIYSGFIVEDSSESAQRYDSRNAFLQDFQNKKSTLRYAASNYMSDSRVSQTGVFIEKEYQWYTVFVAYGDKIYDYKNKENSLNNFRYPLNSQRK